MMNTPMVHAAEVIAAYGGSAEEMVRRRDEQCPPGRSAKLPFCYGAAADSVVVPRLHFNHLSPERFAARQPYSVRGYST